MYPPPLFKPDRSACLAFAAARGFGLACAYAAAGPIASPLPFTLRYARDGTPLLSFHVARHNPLARCADARTPWLMAVTAGHAYVSADWYVSPGQVPTWLYRSVHLSGPAALLSAGELEAHLNDVSAAFEIALAPKPPWTTAKLAAGRRNAMQQAIVGVTMRVDAVEGSFKLNQHKSDADHIAVAAALARQPDPGAQEIASEMVALRPYLDYTVPAFAGDTA